MNRAPTESRHDVVVVGGGGSGLAAAIGAAAAGARVLVLERNAFLRGSTGMSVGSITSSSTDLQRRRGIVDTPDEHFADMGVFTGALETRDNLELRRILVDEVPETVRWLTSLGAVFFGPMPEPPHRKPRMHNILPNSRAYIQNLRKECQRLKVDILLHARARKLIVRGDRVVGVETTVKDAPQRHFADRAVILASGDYNAGSALRSRYTNVSADVEGININEGDGQLMALDLGAEILNGDIVWGPLMRFVPPRRLHPLNALPASRLMARTMRFALERLPGGLLRPFIMSFVTTFLGPERSLFTDGAILMNRHGQRFAEELDKPAHDVPLQPGKCAYIVMDGAVMRKYTAWPHFVSTAPGMAYAYLPDYRRTRKDVYNEAPSLDGLADRLGIDRAAFRATIDGYNQALARGDIPGRSAAARPISEPPFCALGPVESRVVITDGGLRVSLRHEVLRSDGTPIAGLLAAGSTGQGGLLLEGHGHHLAWAFTSGRRAGRFAAELPPGPA
ncbi:MAG: FAD-dependent oxidoreductase [Rhodospirillales bacterium]|nr:FAD-dependent oxidoreductase [Rhodospirillales bacterium]